MNCAERGLGRSHGENRALKILVDVCPPQCGPQWTPSSLNDWTECDTSDVDSRFRFEEELYLYIDIHAYFFYHTALSVTTIPNEGG